MPVSAQPVNGAEKSGIFSGQDVQLNEGMFKQEKIFSLLTMLTDWQ